MPNTAIKMAKSISSELRIADQGKKLQGNGLKLRGGILKGGR